ncbi:hypothetical protein D9757_006072 [Collybiopsis confluens]|uniref:C2H2-type domain-containing protein n=1 Tax=Collybiopsis confluens TaxID=2823264 RepID=A0A8H5M7D1_9AGAR|nr:hypothetical protein D9757_006072 [Collybiopsis confluens]
MVSFQCHACNDVVKKPKLDQHRGRCHSGFDCIDCSKTFHSPAEYKNHTSCISEAEKYEKSLYKGPTKKPQNHYPSQHSPAELPQDNSLAQRNGSFRGFSGRGRGGRGGGHGGGRTYSSATGANDTPLGTPRYSPSEPVEKFQPALDAVPPLPVPAPELKEADNQIEVETEGKEEKKEKKKEKKRKSIAGEDVQDDARPNKKSKTDSEIIETATDKKKKKKTGEEKEEKKKRKEAKKLATATATEISPVEMADSNGAKEEKKKRRKSKGANVSDVGEDNVFAKSNTADKSEDVEMGDATQVKEKTKKKSKSRGGNDDSTEEAKAATEGTADAKVSRKGKKREDLAGEDKDGDEDTKAEKKRKKLEKR